MKTLLLDTNILLRFITGDPPDQAAQTANLITSAETEKIRLTVLPMVLAEAVFVLTRVYKNPRAKAAAVLSQLISCPGFFSTEQNRMLDALQLFGATKLDFVDCYLAAASVREGFTVVSFDADFGKIKGVQWKSPGKVRN